MSEPYRVSISRIAHGRMSAACKLETMLRAGMTYKRAAARLGIAASTAKHWAGALTITKAALQAESPEARLARLTGWTAALASLGRHDEAGVCEAEARRVELMFARIEARIGAAAGAEDAPGGDLLGWLDTVAGAMGEGADAWTALDAVTAYYDGLRALGAVSLGGGRVRWPDGCVPIEVPGLPGWLPEVPWAVEDVAAWERDVGWALRLL